MKRKIGIFRALDVRLNHAEFAAAFSSLEPQFVANMTAELKSYLKQNKVAYTDIPLKPKWFTDPIYPILKKTDFTPWLEFDPEVLEQTISSMQVFEIYEPYFFYSSQIAGLASRNGIPLITEIWTSFPEHPSQYVPPYNFLVKNVVQKTNVFILRSRKAASYLAPFSIPENKKHVIYHGINLKRFYPLEKSHEKIKILFVGALAAHKGLDDLLTVFADLIAKYPHKLELVICGSGPLRDQIMQAAKHLPIEYKGQVSNLDLPEIYRQADIYCQPSKDFYYLGIKGGEEFAGYTFMEALASGLPIISTYCGGIPEIIGDENMLITQGNKEQLFIALDKYISSASLRSETGLKNRARAVELFDLSKQVKLLEKVVKDIV